MRMMPSGAATAFAASRANLRFRNIANRLGSSAQDQSRPLPGGRRIIEWFDKLPAKVQDKCYLRLEPLREIGHELRRPEADLLRDGIYELRASLGGFHYRILYFFHGAVAAVVSHGIAKERVVPPKEIDRAVGRKKRFEANPAKHTYEEA
jgi:phage-related protein